MAPVAQRTKQTLAVAAAALVLVLGAARVNAQQKPPAATGQNSNSWVTKRGVKFETRSTDWHGGKKAEWERRITGKSGVTKINGVSWGNAVKGTAQTFKNGNSIERLTVTGPSGEVRKVTTQTLKSGKTLKTIRMSDGTKREIISWTAQGTRFSQTIDYDKSGKVSASRRSGHKAPTAQ